MTLARALVEASAAMASAPMPAQARHAALLHLRDAVGVGLAAAGSPVGRPYQVLAARQTSRGAATMFGLSTGAEPEMAALINGGLIHSLEYDDTHTASIVHGSSLAAAVSLAMAEDRDLSGADLIGAFARCWEIMIRIGLATPGGFQQRGFHITSVAGTLAGALIAAEMLDLSHDERVAAIGIALSQAAGVFEFLSNGAASKSLHPGWGAHAGILAAKLAAAGLTGPETALEGRWGLFPHFAGDAAAPAAFAALLGDLGQRWHIGEAAFKLSPCCHFLHPFLEAAGLAAAAGYTPDRIARLLCRVPRGAAPIICEPWPDKQRPATGHAMRWSLPATVAARLVENEITLSTFERAPSPAVLDLARRIAWEPLEPSAFPTRFEAEIVVEGTDGSRETISIADAYGNASRPAGQRELDAKFTTNAARVLSADAVAALQSALDGLADAPRLAPLSSAIRQTRQG
ncbi:MmgE/PrpD family protein [Bosea sp. (in: a-proteobacteria)]|uniref:MmgE/PrpD family protein n=1 Tax=Bosea sp. (in: a-proteobacteria) TaxID=1871050 RepID=UPI00260D3666|nr:MmgE/PrpD family protein [Bosea sp. (in: a-proteobacteria)]MCO5090591.1 MmgE/PrpD family protein [Bosea sp. (in: a-proteobacteria)]